MNNSKPIQYQRGWVEFYKLKFFLTEDVLIPRPETELLVDEIIQFSKNNSHLTPLKILDIGTGSGAIAIALAKNIPKINITASDISKKALSVAQKNASFHNIQPPITFINSNLLEKISGNFDCIVTNLPYIPTNRIPYLDSLVKDYEPIIALDGGQDGFKLYRQLFRQMKQKNIIPKFFAGEIDYTQSQIAYLAALSYFPNFKIDVKLDFYHRQRILLIFNP